MKKERMLQLNRGWDGFYRLCYLNGHLARSFCYVAFHRICPSLKLENDQSQKVKFTQLKNGIKLEKIGKPIKG